MTTTSHEDIHDGELVTAREMEAALTAGTFVYPDGATQTFSATGRRTTFVDRGRPTHGTWEIVADGRFASFWPPGYRAEYVVRWIVQGDARVGISFTETRGGDRFDGLYR